MSNPAPYVTKALSDEVRGAARREGVTQAQLADSTGLSLTTVQRLLAGKRDMDATQLTLIATAINVPADELLRLAIIRAERMSEAAPQNVTTLKPKKRVDDMSVDEIERLPHAATVDPEMDEPEQFD